MSMGAPGGGGAEEEGPAQPSGPEFKVSLKLPNEGGAGGGEGGFSRDLTQQLRALGAQGKLKAFKSLA